MHGYLTYDSETEGKLIRSGFTYHWFLLSTRKTTKQSHATKTGNYVDFRLISTLFLVNLLNGEVGNKFELRLFNLNTFYQKEFVQQEKLMKDEKWKTLNFRCIKSEEILCFIYFIFFLFARLFKYRESLLKTDRRLNQSKKFVEHSKRFYISIREI